MKSFLPLLLTAVVSFWFLNQIAIEIDKNKHGQIPIAAMEMSSFAGNLIAEVDTVYMDTVPIILIKSYLNRQMTAGEYKRWNKRDSVVLLMTFHTRVYYIMHDTAYLSPYRLKQ